MTTSRFIHFSLNSYSGFFVLGYYKYGSKLNTLIDLAAYVFNKKATEGAFGKRPILGFCLYLRKQDLSS